MESELTLDTIERELSQAEAARASGKDGRARVCARRAAGWAVVLYRRQLGESIGDQHVLHNLTWLQDEHANEMVQLAARRLMTRVKTDHRLPHPEDPLDDARLIIAHLLGHN